MQMQKAREFDTLIAPTGDAALLEGKVRRVVDSNQFEGAKPSQLVKCATLSRFNATARSDFTREKTERLTSRQGEVFNLAMQGLITKEIARVLNLSHRTVEVHRAQILRRLGYSAFSQLMQEMLGSNRR